VERTKIEKIADGLYNYIISPSRVEPFILIVGEEVKSRRRKSVDFTIGNKTNLDEFTKILNGYLVNIKKYIKGSISIKELENDNDDSGFFYKEIDEFDLKALEQFTSISLIDNSINLVNFLIPNKYKHVFLLVELNLDETGSKRIILFKGVSQTYYTAKNKFTVSPFNDEHLLEVKYIDNKKSFIFDDNFEIAAFLDDTNGSFLFVQNRRKFEDLFGYHEKYESAYSMLSSKLDFIDWNKAEPTLNIKRYCYSIVNYDRFEECIDNLINDLLSTENNEIKMAFNLKKIRYDVKPDGKVHIAPENSKQLNSLLHIMNDGVAKTCLLGRNVLGTKFEELT
jgi:hypothetical protein